MVVLAHLVFSGCRVALTLYAIALQASTLVVGLQVSLLSLLPMLFSVRLGRWLDRVGLRRPAALALSMLLIGASLPALWPAIPILCLASVLIGSGFMLLHMTVYNEVGHAVPAPQRVRAFTLLSMGFSASTVVAPVLSGVLIDSIGHRLTFTVFPLFAVVAWAILRSPWVRTADRTEQPGAPTRGRVADLLREPRMRAIFLLSALLSMAWDMFTFMVPVQGARIGLSASTIGLIMGCFGVATFVVRAAMPLVQRWFDEWQTLWISLAVTAVAYLLFPLFSAVPVLLALAFINGLSLGCTQPMVMSLIHTVAPPGRTGEALGVRSTIMNGSQVFLPLLFGGVGAAAGMVPAFWALALMLGAGAVYGRRHAGGQRPER